jgi:tetratricopeptide (TPR) repeat protein
MTPALPYKLCFAFAIASLCAAQGLPRAQSGAACVSSEELRTLPGEVQALASGARWEDLSRMTSRLVLRCPQYAPARYWLGVAQLRLGHTFASIRELRRALELADTPGTHMLLAEAYLMLNQRTFFKEEIAAVFERAPQLAGAHYLAGLYYYLVENNWEEGVKHFQAELTHDAGHFQALCYLGLCYQALGRKEQAEAAFLKAIEAADREKIGADLPLQLLAALYLDDSRDAAALPYAKRAAALSPTSAKNRFLLGKAAWGVGDQAAAIAALEAAVQLDPTLTDAHYLLGRIYAIRGEDAKAREQVLLFQQCKELYGTK